MLLISCLSNHDRNSTPVNQKSLDITIPTNQVDITIPTNQVYTFLHIKLTLLFLHIRLTLLFLHIRLVLLNSYTVYFSSALHLCNVCPKKTPGLSSLMNTTCLELCFIKGVANTNAQQQSAIYHFSTVLPLKVFM